LRIAAILALALAGLLLTDGSTEASTITSPDTTGNVGEYTSLALDASGNPVISYYNTSSDDLKVLHCDDPNCQGIETPTSPDTTGNVGQYTSLALDDSGNPVVSYYDVTNGDLKVLHCGNANCTAGNSVTSPDPDAATRDVGKYTSLVLDGSGNPVVSYYDATNGDLKVLHCDDPNCQGVETPTSPDTTDWVGWDTSLVLDTSGNPVVSYRYHTADGDLKVLHCGNANCSAGNSITSPDTAGDAGWSTSLALDASGNPVVSYYVGIARDLKVLHCNDSNCAGGDESITSPDTAGDVGYYTSLALDTSGNPVVSYYDVTNQNLKVLHCGDANCAAGNSITSPDKGGWNGTSLALDAAGNPVVSYLSYSDMDLKVLHCSNGSCGAFNTITAPDTEGDVGEFTSLALDAGGRPVVSYFDRTNGNLKVLHCGNPDCTAGNSITSPDTAGTVGTDTSLALDSSGNPVVSYYDNTNGDLKVMHCNDANCAGGNESITSPDTDGGAWSSLALDASGNPVVSYSDAGPVYNQNLKVMHCNDPNCAGGDESITLVDTAGVYFSWISLALDAGGNPVASYMHNWNPSQLKVLHCGNPNCTSGNSIIWADTVGDVGWCTSLALDASGFPVVSYHEGTTGNNLKVMHCNDANCAGSDESITSPDTAGSVGSYTSLALDASGNPVVSYGDWGNGYLKVMHCNDPDCTGDDESITSPDTVGGADWDYYTSLALDAAGNPVVSYHDASNDDLKVLHCDTPTCGPGEISTVAGQYDTPGFADGAPANARFDSPQGIHETADGSLYIADKNNDAIRKTDPATGNVSTVAGRGAGCVANPTPPHDGCLATQATLSDPRDVFDYSPPGDLYIADTGNHRIRKVDGDGYISTIAGTGTQGYSGDEGAATAAKLDSPSGVAIDTSGNVYIADTGNNRIRKVDAATGIITTIAGDGTAGYAGDHGAATSAALNGPRDVFPWGSMYAGTTDLIIADTGNNRIRWVHGPSGLIDTLAGTGTAGFDGDGGPAVEAKLKAPEAVASDASLAVYVADTQNDRIRRIGFGDAVIATIAGGGSGCPANSTPPYDGCPATDAVLDKPAGFAVGSCIGSDTDNETIRKIDCATGLPVGGFTGATGCTYGTVATIDLAFVLLPLAIILRRSRIGTWFLGTRKVGRP